MEPVAENMQIPEDSLLIKYKDYFTVDSMTGVIYIPFIFTENLLSSGMPSVIKEKLEMLKYNLQ